MAQTKDSISSSRNRVLVWGLSNNLAGTEGMISNIVHACQKEIAFDFITTCEVPNHADLTAMPNNRLFILPEMTTYSKDFNEAMSAHFDEHANEYSAVWSNLCDPRNITALELAYKHEVPRRILHSHNSDYHGPGLSKALGILRKRKVKPMLTDRWACSQVAGRYMFGSESFEVIPNAIPFEKYVFDASERSMIRSSLGIPQDAFVLGYIGRLVESKNHAYLLDLIANSRSLKSVYLIFVGDGPFKSQLLDQVGRLQLDNRVFFVPSTNAVAAYYSCFDVFAFPSMFEGLPLVLLEAQANGLPVVMSSSISDEGIISNSVYRVPLENREAWVHALFSASRDSFQLSEKSDSYNLEKQTQFLLERFRGLSSL